MFLPTKPSDAAIEKFLLRASSDTFSYDDVGATRSKPPAGFDVDHNRQLIGNGREDFEKAKDAIRSWKMFDFPWVRLAYTDTPIEVGREVAMIVKHFGFYSMSSARIVYVIDEPERFGFAYGTLTGHVERGEERFSVELHPEIGRGLVRPLCLFTPEGAVGASRISCQPRAPTEICSRF